MTQDRTIAAVSTPQGTGGIAVIRVSGSRAVEIADSIFSGNILNAATHTVHYGYILNNKKERIDEVLVTVMLAPRSFTCENTVEISCHGGTAAVRAVLDALIAAGAYPAAAGEFTKRAFLNGRIDLSQAEAVIDIINAKNELSRRTAVAQLGGTLSRRIKAIRDRLVHLSAQMQVIIDYPDEDLEDVTAEDIESTCRGADEEIKQLLRSADSGRIIKDGIKTVIAGKPNVGKSSILNYLAQTERAIVSDIAGTTRDVIEESLTINGIPLIVSDTAGIRETGDVIEKIGVERSKQYIDAADLVIVVIDSSVGINDEDREVLAAAEGKPSIIVLNKTDISDNTDIPNIECGTAVIPVSALTGDGMDKLQSEISRLCELDKLQSENGAVITNMRHKAALTAADTALTAAADALAAGMPTDIASIDIAAAMDALGEITGETVSDSIVDDIFHNFCVGK